MKIKVMAALLLVQMFMIGSAAHAGSIEGVVSNFQKATNVSKEQSNAYVKAVFTAIEDELQAGKDVTVRNFGRFYVKELAARKGRNPRTGEAIQIPARKYPRFSSSDNLKSAMNK